MMYVKMQHLMSRSILFITIALFVNMTTGCSIFTKNSKSNKFPVYYSGTIGYKEAIKKYNLTPNDAKKIISDYRSKEVNRTIISSPPQALFGDKYLFSTDHDKLGIPLRGYYVDANTGEVKWKNSPYRIPHKFIIYNNHYKGSGGPVNKWLGSPVKIEGNDWYLDY